LEKISSPRKETKGNMDNHFTPEAIKQLRKSLKLTQSGLAKKLKVEAITISRWECGQRHPTKIMQRRLNRLLGKVE